MKNIKNKLLLAARRKAQNSYRAKPFDSDYLDIFGASKILKYVFSAVSVVTGFFYVSNIFENQLGSFQISTTIAVFILLSIEFLKYFLTPKGLNRFLKAKYIDATLLLCVAIPLYLVSVFFSINGVKELFDKIPNEREENKVEVVQKSDSLLTYYDNQIKTEQEKISIITKSSAENGTLKWKTTVDQLTRLENRVDGLMESKQKAIESLSSTMNTEFDKVAEKSYNNLEKIVYISIVTEFLLFLCFLFSEYYLYRSFRTFIYKKAKNGNYKK
jgi:hypothetical protein